MLNKHIFVRKPLSEKVWTGIHRLSFRRAYWCTKPSIYVA